MTIFNREELIIEVLEKNKGYCSVEMLAKECKVSTMTIRRDLDRLQLSGILQKRHGAAALNKFLHKEISYSKRENLNIDIKKNIATSALEFIEDDSIILLDAGTTTLTMAYLLGSVKKNMTIITNDISIASYLSSINMNVCIAGGFIENVTACTSSVFTIDFLKTLNVDISFMAMTSINNDFDCMVSTAEKAAVKKTMMSIARKTVLLVDDSKFGVSSFCKVAEIKDFSHIITNYSFDNKDKKYIENSGCCIINV